MKSNYKHRLAGWLLLPLMASGCATNLPPSPPAVTPPEIPSMPAVAEPPPSGSYWQRLTDWRESLRQRLSSTPAR